MYFFNLILGDCSAWKRRKTKSGRMLTSPCAAKTNALEEWPTLWRNIFCPSVKTRKVSQHRWVINLVCWWAKCTYDMKYPIFWVACVHKRDARILSWSLPPYMSWGAHGYDDLWPHVLVCCDTRGLHLCRLGVPTGELYKDIVCLGVLTGQMYIMISYYLNVLTGEVYI